MNSAGSSSGACARASQSHLLLLRYFSRGPFVKGVLQSRSVREGRHPLCACHTSSSLQSGPVHEGRHPLRAWWFVHEGRHPLCTRSVPHVARADRSINPLPRAARARRSTRRTTRATRRGRGRPAGRRSARARRRSRRRPWRSAGGRRPIDSIAPKGEGVASVTPSRRRGERATSHRPMRRHTMTHDDTHTHTCVLPLDRTRPNETDLVDRAEDRGARLAREPREERRDRGGGRRVEPRRRLVTEDDARLLRERDRDAQPAALAVREADLREAARRRLGAAREPCERATRLLVISGHVRCVGRTPRKRNRFSHPSRRAVRPSRRRARPRRAAAGGARPRTRRARAPRGTPSGGSPA